MSIYGKKPISMTYHAEKTDECLMHGIRLLHIFEDEWTVNKKLCKSKLKKVICPSMTRHIDAGRCSIVVNEDSTLKC